MKKSHFVNSVLKEFSQIDKLSRNDIQKKIASPHKGNKLSAFALCQKAIFDVLGKTPYETQLIAGKELSNGNIIEMKTGEGKTISEVFPAYWFHLNNLKVHIITANEYLAQRDYMEMENVFNYLGMSSGCISNVTEIYKKKEIYQKDVVYGTCQDFGFDFLRDNLVSDSFAKVQQPLGAVIVDEADSILIDDAKIPLIISQQFETNFKMFMGADGFVKTLAGGTTDTFKSQIDEIVESTNKNYKGTGIDYLINKQKNTIYLTDKGEQSAYEFFQFGTKTPEEISKINHFIYQALRANFLMKRDRDYIVENSQINIIDQNTGRSCPDRQFSEGLHQALEIKEHLKVRPETTIAASITVQKYIMLYRKFCGMTGTASTEQKEFSEVYNKKVVIIPPHSPCKRIDHKDLIYSNLSEKYAKIMAIIKEHHKTGQPILVGTASVETSEAIFAMLKAENMNANILNAKNNKNEASIIAQAGRLGSITIATDIAGRGTDICLGGNPEALTKNRMIQLGFKELNVFQASIKNSSTFENPEIKKKYNEIYKAYKRETEKEKEKVIALGGLCVIGTERHDSRRIDNQLIGRCARQGDPGISQFVLSKDDRLFDRFDSSKNFEKKFKSIGLGEPLKASDAKHLVQKAQIQHENMNFTNRKSVLEYDEIDDTVRHEVYEYRNTILVSKENRKEIYQYLNHGLKKLVYTMLPCKTPTIGEISKFKNFCVEILNIEEQKLNKLLLTSKFRKEIFNNVFHLLYEQLSKIDSNFKKENSNDSDYQESLNSFYKFILISSIDFKMQKTLKTLDGLKKIVSIYSYGTEKAEDIYLKQVLLQFENFKSEVFIHALGTVNKFSELEIHDEQPFRRVVI